MTQHYCREGPPTVHKTGDVHSQDHKRMVDGAARAGSFMETLNSKEVVIVWKKIQNS